MAYRKKRDYDHNDGQRKKARGTDISEIEKRLESLITRVGEKTSSSIESKLEGLARVLDADFTSFKPKIIEIIGQCVLKMPEKMSIYATLVGLLNVKNSDAGREIIESLVKRLKISLKNGDFHAGLAIVNFFADLCNANVLILNSVINLFENFLDVLNEQTLQIRCDWYVYAVLTSIPIVGQLMLNDEKQGDLEKIFSKIDNYMKNRVKTYTPILQVWKTQSNDYLQVRAKGNNPNTQSDTHFEYLDALWLAVTQAFKWNASLINNDIMDRQLDLDDNSLTTPVLKAYSYGVGNACYTAFETELSQALVHTLPTIIPPIHDPNFSTYPVPRWEFVLFEQSDIPEGYYWPPPTSLDKLLVLKDMHSIIRTHYKDRKHCAAELLSYRLKPKVPLNYMIVECLFSELFALPQACHIEVMYAALFIELCKLQPSSLPPVLAQATELLFDRLDNMHTMCMDRFSNWFSHHLSNFQYKWSWEDWEACLDQDVEMPQPKFIHETLIKCIRLSYYQRILAAIPCEPLKRVLMPPPVEPNYIFDFGLLTFNNRTAKNATNKTTPENGLKNDLGADLLNDNVIDKEKQDAMNVEENNELDVDGIDVDFDTNPALGLMKPLLLFAKAIYDAVRAKCDANTMESKILTNIDYIPEQLVLHDASTKTTKTNVNINDDDMTETTYLPLNELSLTRIKDCFKHKPHQVHASCQTVGGMGKMDTLKGENTLKNDLIANLGYLIGNHQHLAIDNVGFIEQICDLDARLGQVGSKALIYGPNTCLKVAIFIQTMLHYGNKSISHTYSIIAKYFNIFKRLADNEELQNIVLRSIYQYYRFNSQMVTVICEKMIKTQLLTGLSVLQWVFSNDMSHEFTRSYVWNEIVIRCCLNRAHKRVTLLQKDIHYIQAQLEAKGIDEENTTQNANEDEMNHFERTPLTPDERKLKQDELVRMQERLETYRSEEKKMFLIVFQRLLIVLNEYLTKCDSENVNYRTPWFKYTLERTEQIFLTFHEMFLDPGNELGRDLMSSLENLMFTSDLDSRIVGVFQQFRALSA